VLPHLGDRVRDDRVRDQAVIVAALLLLAVLRAAVSESLTAASHERERTPGRRCGRFLLLRRPFPAA
jgi:hypothetical protein